MSPHCLGNVLETWLRPGKKSGDVLQMSWAILQRHRRDLKVPCSRIFFAEINCTNNADVLASTLRQLCDLQVSAIISNGLEESLAASDSLRLVLDLWRAHLHITGHEMIARLIQDSSQADHDLRATSGRHDETL